MLFNTKYLILSQYQYINFHMFLIVTNYEERSGYGPSDVF